VIYIHIPYCRSFCTYCDFYSEVASRCSTFGGYAEALSAEIAARSEEIRKNVSNPSGVDTLYIGGGTPSVLPLHVFESVLDSLGRAGCKGPFREFTVEVNPEDIVEKGHSYVEGLLRLGVNRISMGVQSFDDAILKWMNRRHDSARAVQAYSILEECGVENISIDLIFGLPQLSSDDWKRGLDRALGISPSGRPPRHISSYQLSVEEGSALAALLAKGKWEEASDQVCAQQYESLCAALRDAGYHHYEISNFAQPGYEAVHNSAYWRHEPYIGLGPGAHSFTPGSRLVRQWNESDLGAYIEAGKMGDFAKVCGGEVLTEEQVVLEKVMLGLRTSEGLPEVFLMDHCDTAALAQALSCGNLNRLPQGRIRIPENRFFVSDNIISSLV
jgi:oxygen-independent coproporphyrinogen-3 oxidase